MTVLRKTNDVYWCLGDCCALTAEGKPQVSERQLPFTQSPHPCPGFSLCKEGGNHHPLCTRTLTVLPCGTTAMYPHGNTAPLSSSLHLCRARLTGRLSPCCRHSLGCPGTATAVRFLTCRPFCFPSLSLEMQKVQPKYLMWSCRGLGRIALVHAPVWW